METKIQKIYNLGFLDAVEMLLGKDWEQICDCTEDSICNRCLIKRYIKEKQQAN